MLKLYVKKKTFSNRIISYFTGKYIDCYGYVYPSVSVCVDSVSIHLCVYMYVSSMGSLTVRLPVVTNFKLSF